VRRTDQRRAAVFICYQRDVTGAQLPELIDRNTPSAFTRELVEGTEAHREDLDELIEEQAIDWHVERIAPLERAILRVALFEIFHRPDVPDEVAIDEAVETAKLYCGTQAPGFVNGILGGVLRKVRERKVEHD
jgi:N utilization substance protein B